MPSTFLGIDYLTLKNDQYGIQELVENLDLELLETIYMELFTLSSCKTDKQKRRQFFNVRLVSFGNFKRFIKNVKINNKQVVKLLNLYIQRKFNTSVNHVFPVSSNYYSGLVFGYDISSVKISKFPVLSSEYLKIQEHFFPGEEAEVINPLNWL